MQPGYRLNEATTIREAHDVPKQLFHASIYIYDPLCNDKFTDSILVFYLFPIRIRNLSWQHFATRYQDELLQCKLDDQTNSTESSSNSVHLLVNGVQSFARRYENLSTAKFIYLKTFLFTNDEKGRRMASGLAERAEAGIPVVLQYDVKGSIESTEVVKDMLKQATPSNPFGEKSIIQKMRNSGVIIVPTNSPVRP